MNLEHSQELQESQYEFPYHWFKSPGTFDGRLYFGYLNQCLEIITDSNKKESKILEVGCGDGRFLGLLRESGFENLYGSDYSEAGVAFARLFLPGVDFTVADATIRLPYENNVFDAIFLIETLEHIQLNKVSLIISELTRILKPGGKLVITVPSTLVPVHPKHYQHFTVESLKNIIEPQLKVKEIRGQDAANLKILQLLYKFLDNRWWQLKKSSYWYNTHIWTKHFNKCDVKFARRFIACAQKIK